MLILRSGSVRLCDGLTRREAMLIGASGALGLTLPSLWAARSQGGHGPRARSCIVLWMTGGPPQHETWDPKPEAPAEIRGPFGSIPTSIPGVRVGELMPRTARNLHRLCVIRSVVTNNPGHVGGTYEMLTGVDQPGGKGNESIVASRTDFPTLGTIVKRFRRPVRGVPTSVVFPQPVFNVPFYPGQDAGFLGGEWDPWRLTIDPHGLDAAVRTLEGGVSAEQLDRRRVLLDNLERKSGRLAAGAGPGRFKNQAAEAFDLLTGPRTREAFRLDREAPALRDRYGRHPFGQGCLLARRLVESGVSLVQLNWHREPNDEQPMWDCHHMMEWNLGAQPWDFMGTPTWMVTHTHLDHIAALPVYVARRRMMKMEPPTIYLPEVALEDVRRLLLVMQRLDRGRQVCELKGVRPGDEIELSRDHVVSVHATTHTVPSVGYLVWERRRKLKEEYHGLPGDRIRDLRLSGVEVTKEVRTPLLGYTGDTSPAGLDDNPDLFRAKVLITELSFIRAKHRRDKIHKFGHMHLDDFLERADRFENELLIVGHFSTRYHPDEVRRLLDQKLPPQLKQRMRLWI